ncbi:MAG: squalene/phytoene synthase family protein, partial [Rhizobiales bacterium]|nr:squalene/phytoene synthase family protein [Rhizobacter sp.]
MQTLSPLSAQPHATPFGSRPPEPRGFDARADLAACRAALRSGSKTFLAASFLLPRGTHEPAAALYAFCRLADDAVDAAGGAGAVANLRERLDLAYAGTPYDDP